MASLANSAEGRQRYVTKAMREVEFLEPVFLGDIVSFYTETVRIGRTSITVRVIVEAERWSNAAKALRETGGTPPVTAGPPGHGERVKVTEAEVVLVAVDDQGRPVPIRPEVPPA